MSSVLNSNTHALSSCSLRSGHIKTFSSLSWCPLSFSPGLQKRRFRHIMLSLPQLQIIWLTANVFCGWTTSNTDLISLDLISLFFLDLQNLGIRQLMLSLPQLYSMELTAYTLSRWINSKTVIRSLDVFSLAPSFQDSDITVSCFLCLNFK